MPKKLFFSFIAVLFSVSLFASNTVADYIGKWKSTAQQNMQTYGIPASIILAQGVLESGAGKSMLATEANNHFGIKCHEWTGAKIYHDDDKKNECFRKYPSARLSYKDHALFLKNKSRYAFLFDLKPTNYKAWAKGLKKAGYATNPKYPQLLIDIIEKNELYKFDEEVAKGKFVPEKEQEEVTAEVESTSNLDKKPKKNSGNSVIIHLDRELLKHENNIEYVLAKEGETPELIASELELGLWQIMKYNNVKRKHIFQKDEVIFTQPKKRKGKSKTTLVDENETLRDVSQRVGVKIKRLVRFNAIDENAKLSTGQTLKLRKR